jgi:tetratricopeptide (TPR) repeat protein
MNCRLQSVLRALASLVVASAVPLANAAEAQWVEIQSPHFSVITDAGEKRGREVAMRFEQMRAVFAALMTNANVNIPIPLQIVAFRNTKELRQIAPLWHGKPIQLAGLFEPGQDRSFIMLDMSVESPWTVVFHEYAHQLMNGVLTVEMDPWFEEGFAEYFSSIEVDSKEARVGKIPSEEYEVLQQQGTMKIADLFKVQHNSSTYNENGGRRTVFYAESGMLVHYLYDHNLIPKLATYFALKIDKNMAVEDAIQHSFGMSASQFDKELRNYVNGYVSKYYPISNPPNIVSKNYAMKPLRSTDAAAVVADIHLHSPDYREQAIKDFQEILKEEPDNAAACRGLGYAYLQKQDFIQAGEYFKRAAKEDSRDPRVHYYSALLMSTEGSFTGSSGLPEMTKELETAIGLDPSFADAYALLGFARMRSGDKVGALSVMLKAISLSPRNENYRLNLAQMYLNSQQPEQAIPILEMLRKSGDRQVALRAGELLRTAQDFQASMRAVHAANSLPTKVIADRGAMSGSVQGEKASTETDSAEMIPSQAPIKFIKGTVQNVDCSAPPAATLKVVSGGKTWTMRVTDSKHVLVLGAAEFSCAWNRQQISVNYRETSDTAGTVVSVEVQ